jgi:hypothetical protein
MSMDVEIGEVSSTVRSVDGDTLLAPRVLQRIVAAVAAAIREGGERETRARGERRITGGVSAERDEAQ